MKQQFSTFFAIAAYFCITAVFFLWRPDSFAKDILVAPLYFLVPAGIGLLILAANNTHHKLLDWLSKPQVLLSGFFVGFVATTLVYQELERQDVLRAVFVPIYFTLLGLSLLGYYRAREILVVDRNSLRNASSEFLWMLPVAAVTYYFHYVHFTSFPLRDIFQQTHFMKGALEFSQAQILNPYITGSYLPYMQILLGQLHHFYGVDLFRAQWILPAVAFFFHLSCYAVFISSLTRDQTARRIALLLMIVLAPAFQLENMIMQESMLLVLFSILLRRDDKGGAVVSFKLNVVLLVALLIAYHFYFDYYYSPPSTAMNAPPAHYTSMWIFALLFFSVISLMRERGLHAIAFLILFAVSAFAVHRAVLLFMPIVLFAYIVHNFIHHPDALSAMKKRLAPVFRVVAGLAIMLFAVLTYRYLNAGDMPGEQGGDSSPTTNIAGYLLRTPVFVGGGTGINHSLVEYLRLLPPLVHVLISILFLWFVFWGQKQPVELKPQSGSGPEMGDASPWFFIATLPVLIMVVLSTIPYVYRGAFFPMTLGIVLFAVLAARFLRMQGAGCGVACRVVAAFIAIYLIAATALWYSSGNSFLGDTNTYLAKLSPFTGVLLVVALAGAGVLIFSQKPGRVRDLGFTAAVIGALALDAFSFRALFYEKAFRDRLPDSGIISHYSKEELFLAEKLRSYPVKTIMISDPYTLSILRAATGFNSIYSFANINIVTHPRQYLDMFQYLKSLDGTHFSREKAEQLAVMANRMLKTAGAEGMYIWNRTHVNGNQDLVTFDAFYDNFIWILSAKTLSWAEGRDGYYPDNTPLPASLIESLKSYFNIEINMDGRLLAMKLKRHESMGVPSSALKKTQPCACPE